MINMFMVKIPQGKLYFTYNIKNDPNHALDLVANNNCFDKSVRKTMIKELLWIPEIRIGRQAEIGSKIDYGLALTRVSGKEIDNEYRQHLIERFIEIQEEIEIEKNRLPNVEGGETPQAHDKLLDQLKAEKQIYEDTLYEEYPEFFVPVEELQKRREN